MKAAPRRGQAGGSRLRVALDRAETLTVAGDFDEASTVLDAARSG